MNYKTSDYTISYKDDQETKDKIFNKLLEFCKEHECWHGETYCQCDDPQIAMNELFPEILEECFEFEVKYNE